MKLPASQGEKQEPRKTGGWGTRAGLSLGRESRVGGHRVSPAHPVFSEGLSEKKT